MAGFHVMYFPVTYSVMYFPVTYSVMYFPVTYSVMYFPVTYSVMYIPSSSFPYHTDELSQCILGHFLFCSLST